MRQKFIDHLIQAALAPSGKVLVLLTMRADFYGHCAFHPQLAAMLSDHQALIGPMSEQEIERAIEQPAYLHGLTFEPGLVDTLVKAVMGSPGALPLLQDTLASLWERRVSQQLSFKAYKALGELAGALKNRADSLFEALDEPQQTLCQTIFVRLTQIGEGSEDTKKQVPLVDLVPAGTDPKAVEKMVSLLVNARLLTTEKHAEHGSMVEIIHEALLSGWPRLKDWLAQNREALWIHQRFTHAMKEWRDMEQDPSYLYTGARLQQAREWATVYDEFLNEGEKAFLNASVERYEKELQAEQQRQARELKQAKETALRIGKRNKIISVVAIAAFALAFVAIWLFSVAQDERDEAITARGQAEDIMDFMITDLQSALEQVGRLDILKSASDKALGYYSNVNDSRLTGDGHARRIKMLIDIGYIQRETGRIDEAKKTYQVIKAKAKEYLALNPYNTEVKIDLADANFHQGTLYFNESQFEQALASFNQQKTVAQEILSTDKTNEKALQQLANAYVNISNTLTKLGRFQEALSQTKNAISIQKELLEQDPENIIKQRNLSQGYVGLGYTLVSTGDYQQAITTFKEASRVIESALARFPKHSEFKRQLISVYLVYGQSHLYLGQFELAQEKINLALEMIDELLKIDAGNNYWLALKSRGHSYLSEIYALNNTIEKSRKEINQSLKIIQSLKTQTNDVRYGSSELGYQMRNAHIYYLEKEYSNALEILNRYLPEIEEKNMRQLIYFQALGNCLAALIHQQRGNMDLVRTYIEKSRPLIEQVMAGPDNTRIQNLLGLYQAIEKTQLPSNQNSVVNSL